jgi:putative phosphoribosyl transferase
MMFRNRRTAGQALAKKLKSYTEKPEVVVLGLARGGLPVAEEVAKKLQAPLDVFLVQKLGVPGHEELALGAIASGGVQVLNREVVASLDISSEKIEMIADREKQELARRERAYRDGGEKIDLKDKIVILVDDGLATGASMRAAVEAVQQVQPRKTVVAVPVAASDVCVDFNELADEVICVETPARFGGVGAWYGDFPQVTDEQVRQILKSTQRA